MCNNPKLDLVNMNAFIKFGEILPIGSQDIEGKLNFGVNQASRAITLVKIAENIMHQSQARSCQYQCIYKVW